MLTEMQKNVAVRLAVSQPMKMIADEFHLSLQTICGYLKSQEFLEYKNQLSESSKLQVIQYLESKQMKCAKRLEKLSEQNVDLKVAHRATVDIMGYSGIKNANTPAINLNNVNHNIAQAQATAEIPSADVDKEIDEIDAILDGEEMEVINEEPRRIESSKAEKVKA